jgi:hypothetical protein
MHQGQEAAIVVLALRETTGMTGTLAALANPRSSALQQNVTDQ